MSGKLAILLPTAERRNAPSVPLAPRLVNLEGTTIGFITNGWRSGDVVFEELRRLLKQHGVKEIVERRTPQSRPLALDEFQALADASDAVVSGLGN